MALRKFTFTRPRFLMQLEDSWAARKVISTAIHVFKFSANEIVIVDVPVSAQQTQVGLLVLYF